MAWTETELAALNKAIANGVLSVRYADRTVQYRTLEEMLKLRTMMMDELGLPGATRAAVKHLSYSKGIVA